LVRDYPQASEDLADAIVDALDGIPVVAGIGSNVVQTVKLDTFQTTSSSFVTITGLTATITPSSATSKILVVAQVTHGFDDLAGYGAFLLSGGNTSSYVGDAGGSRVQAVFGGYSQSNDSGLMEAASIVYLDSPNTTSPVTYEVQTRQTQSGTVNINRPSVFGSPSALSVNGASSITVIEVAP
jgi:hypothetical protein